MHSQLLLIAMVVFQLLWLAAIWWTGAISKPKKLLMLSVGTIVVGAGASWVSASSPLQISQFKEQTLFQSQAAIILTFSMLTLSVGTIYAYYQRVWPFDEENNFKAAKIVAEEGIATFFDNYVQIPWLGMQHPPLIPLLGGMVMRIFGKHLFVIRLISLALCVATVVITYFLGLAIYDQMTGLLAALLLLSFPLVLRQGSAAMLDMPITFFFSLVLLMVYHLPRSTSPYQLAVAIGLIMGIGFLAKYTMGLIYAVIFPLFLASNIYHPFLPLLQVIVLLPLSILGVWLLYSAHIGVLARQVNQFVIYSGTKSGNPHSEYRSLRFKLTKGWRMRLRLETLFSRLPSALGAYNIPLLFLAGTHAVGPQGQFDLLIGLWIVVLFVLLIIALPDHRYFMPTFPALAIMMAHRLQSMSGVVEQVIILALLFCGGALYLFVDWSRQSQLFIRPQNM